MIRRRSQRFLASAGRAGLVLSACGWLLLLSGCRLHDVRSATVRAPGVGCAVCAGIAHQALWGLTDDPPATLQAEDGRLWSESESGALRRIEFDLDVGTIEVTYDSMRLALKNLEFAVAGAGFDVDAEPFALPADAAARDALPAECREHQR